MKCEQIFATLVAKYMYMYNTMKIMQNRYKLNANFSKFEKKKAE
jgi:hypothetical protein